MSSINKQEKSKIQFGDTLKYLKRLFRLKLIIFLIGSPGVFKAYQVMDYVIQKQVREEQNEKVSQLSTYASLGAMLKKYEDEVSRDLSKMVSHDWYQKMILNQRGFCRELINKHGRGAYINYSPQFKEYRSVHRFFENLGVLIEYDALEFELIFSLIPFPGDFPDGKYPSDLAENPIIAIDECIGKNWFGKDRPLLDYGASIKRLGYNYNYERMKLKLEQQNYKDFAEADRIRQTIANLETRQCQAFYPADNNQSRRNSWNRLYPQKDHFLDFLYQFFGVKPSNNCR